MTLKGNWGNGGFRTRTAATDKKNGDKRYVTVLLKVSLSHTALQTIAESLECRRDNLRWMIGEATEANEKWRDHLRLKLARVLSTMDELGVKANNSK